MSEEFEKLFDDFYELSEIDFLQKVKSYYLSGGDIRKLSDSYFGSLLHLAAENSYLELIKWLVSKGVDLETKNSQGWTALLLAVDSDIDESVQDNTELNLSTVSLLIDLGANVDAKLEDGKSIYTIAKSYGSRAYNKLEGIVGPRAS